MINLYLSLIMSLMTGKLNVTKRNILMLSVMFFDPLGIIYSLVLQANLYSSTYAC